MSNLVPFSFESHEIRVIANDQGDPWFVANDVSELLGYRNAPDMTRMLDEDEKGTHNLRIRSESGVEQDREMTIISESGLYACILKSRRAEAQTFRKWVTSEVLPTIRKTGKYEAPAATTDLPRPREIREAFACCLSIAKLIGLTGNQASLSADSGTRRLTGVSALALIGQTHLVADVRGKTYTPTELGKMLAEPLTGAKFNRALEEKGLQVKNINNDWLPTETARDHCQWLDTAKRRTDGTPVKQLKWFASILPRLGLLLADRKAA